MEQFILQRIRAIPPRIKEIVPHSVPVASFGDFRNSKVATLGINPSKHEFIYQNGHRRFEDLLSLSLNDHQSISEEDAERIYLSCCRYFICNPYRRWFDKLEKHILSKLGVTYYDGSACHLDLVQWATDPIWRELDFSIRQELLRADIPFLLHQLENSAIEVLIINGVTAYQTFFDYAPVTNKRFDCIFSNNRKCYTVTGILVFESKKVDVLAYNSNLQSTVGLTNAMRDEIGGWISRRIVELKDSGSRYGLNLQ